MNNQQIRVGLVGTGYAAKRRAEALRAEARSRLVAVAGHSPENTAQFSRIHEVEASASWAALVERTDLDLVFIATVNREHGAIAQAALQAGKHVVVEYPLALDLTEAERLAALARSQKRLLHVEHIELLGGLHQAMKQHLPQIGTPFYARYATLKAQHPAPRRWSYHTELFGFPLMAALSRLRRFIDLFGAVTSVSCQERYWMRDRDGKMKAEEERPSSSESKTEEAKYYRACFCKAQLRFATGLNADVIYGKGEAIWQAERCFEVHGARGGLKFAGEQGLLLQAEETLPIAVERRRGLFAKETALVLAHLLEEMPLYGSLADSLYTLRVADAARIAAATGQVIHLGSRIDGYRN